MADLSRERIVELLKFPHNIQVEEIRPLLSMAERAVSADEERSEARRLYGFDGDKETAERIAERAAALTPAAARAFHVVIDSWWELQADGLPGVMAHYIDHDDPDELGAALQADALRAHGWPLTERGARLAADRERLENEAFTREMADAPDDIRSAAASLAEGE